MFQNPVITIAASSQTICEKEVVTFTASGASTYTWAANNATGDTYTATPANSQNYSVVGVDNNGCQGTATTFIKVIVCTSIPEQNSLQGVRLYPNPSTGLIQIEFGFEGAKEVYVSNSVGALVEKYQATRRSKQLTLPDTPREFIL